jgi:membrane-bound lytic murein transglycosylase D
MESMFKIRTFTLLFIILLSVLPVYALEVEHDAHPSDQLVLSTLPGERIEHGPGIVEDYSYNKTAIEAVKRNITLFSDKIKERFSIWLSRSGKYLDLMKGILKEQNVPEDIVFLPLIESGFNANAYSPARAVGYWQFIASTAKRYGLEINWWRDERKDPVKSTVAAANYLKDLYQMFGSWNLAMAAYNAGEGKILKALNKSNTDNYWALLEGRHIRNETKNYVPKFIAASLIANSPQSFGFYDLEYLQPLNYDLVTIKNPVDLDIIAECAETSLEVIKELNPELRRWCTPPDVPEYSIRIPEGKKDVFSDNLSQIPLEKRFTVDTYTVNKRDTLRTISKRTGIPAQVILDLNDMEKVMPLKTGAMLYLPPKEKFTLDRDDKAPVKKASLKTKKKSSGKNRKSHTTKTVKTALLKQKDRKA